MAWSRDFRMRGNMYSISVSYSQIYASLLPGAQPSSYGSHFLIRLVVAGWPAKDCGRAGRPVGTTTGIQRVEGIAAILFAGLFPALCDVL
jgi:hypothetical protein